MTETKNQSITELNNIIKEVITDAKNFSKDIASSIYMNYIAGIMAILFGIQTGWYNIPYITQLDPVPTALVLIQIFAGSMLIIRGYTLQKKYSRLLNLKNKL
ncbi:MAG: hypothetical protein NWF10_00165 [Candidatus Bathyarchaeota archaeon]|nr:hypothetical protein [Candidatus Bathyarchaeota archaeon]